MTAGTNAWSCFRESASERALFSREPPSRRLSIEQLAKLEELLAAGGAPVSRHLKPSASPEALAAVEDFVSLPLPHELRQWWEWHDGTDVKPHERAEKGLIGPLFKFLSTTRAIKFSRQLRDLAVEDAIDDPDEIWGTTWIAIGSQGRVACDCDVDSDAPVPVLNVDYHKASRPGVIAARSLGEMARWWIEALESGAWFYDHQDDRWKRRDELVPRERDLTGLV